MDFAIHHAAISAIDMAESIAFKEFAENRGIASNVEARQGRTGVTYFFIEGPSGILVEFLEDKRGF